MPRHSELRLLDCTVRALPAPARGTRKYRDRDLTGCAVQVTAAGGRSFGLIYRSPVTGAERLCTIGRWPAWSTERARHEAARLKRDVDLGLDPLEERAQARQEREQDRQAPTVADLAERYAAEHLPTKRPRSAAEDRALIRDYLLPALGHQKVADVSKAAVADMHRAITAAGKPVRANRALALARTMFAFAVE